MTKEQFLTILNNSAYWDVAVSINRTNPLPLDRYSVFATLAEATAYVQSNPVAYAGQIIAAFDDNKVATYVVDEVDGSLVLKKIAFDGDFVKKTDTIELFGGNASGWEEV